MKNSHKAASPRKIGKSSSDLPNDPFGANFARPAFAGQAKFGFILLEVILSVLIVASGLLFIIRSYSASLNAQDTAARISKACLLLEEKLFELDVKGKIKEGSSDGIFEGRENYSWRLDAEPLGAKKDINRLNLTVAWSRGGRNRRVGISTFRKYEEG